LPDTAAKFTAAGGIVYATNNMILDLTTNWSKAHLEHRPFAENRLVASICLFREFLPTQNTIHQIGKL